MIVRHIRGLQIQLRERKDIGRSCARDLQASIGAYRWSRRRGGGGHLGGLATVAVQREERGSLAGGGEGVRGLVDVVLQRRPAREEACTQRRLWPIFTRDMQRGRGVEQRSDAVAQQRTGGVAGGQEACMQAIVAPSGGHADDVQGVLCWQSRSSAA